MKEKYEKQLLAYEGFWNRKPVYRPVLNITAPIGEPYKDPVSLEQHWLDDKYLINKALHSSRNTYYAAEAIPFFFPNLGPGSLAACIGGSYTLAENTVWLDRNPIIDDWGSPPEITLNPESEMWKHLQRIQTEALRHPEFNTSLSDIGGVLDVICSLRGTENMLYDLFDYPDEVKEMTKTVTSLWFKAFDAEVERVREANQPYNSWMNLPSLKPWFPLQCDFSYMISPTQFEEFVLPHLVEQVHYMDRSIYHLDGVGELPHLDMLLDIEGLNGIQWSPGDGKPPMWDECWFPMYKKIQDKRKNIVLLIGVSPEDMDGAEKLIKTLDPTGLYIACNAPDKDTADRIVEAVEKWCG